MPQNAYPSFVYQRRATIMATLLTILTGLSQPFQPASALVDLERRGQHPFPPAVIRLTSMIIEANENTFDQSIGDSISGTADGVDQTRANCWFESAVGAVAHTPRGQTRIAQMIKKRSENVFAVTFPDNGQTVLVSRAKIRRDGLKDQAYWSDILEGAILNRFPQLQTSKIVANLRPVYGVPNNATLGLKFMTGSQPSNLMVKDMSDAGIERIIMANLRQQIPTTASTLQPPEMPKPIIVVPDHVFAILRYNQATKLITLRNPWGKNRSAQFPHLPQQGQSVNGVTDIGGGVIQMHLSQFRKYYAALSWAVIQ